MKAYIVIRNHGDGYGHGSSEYLAVCLTWADADRIREQHRHEESQFVSFDIEESIFVVFPPKETES